LVVAVAQSFPPDATPLASLQPNPRALGRRHTVMAKAAEPKETTLPEVLHCLSQRLGFFSTYEAAQFTSRFVENDHTSFSIEVSAAIHEAFFPAATKMVLSGVTATAEPQRWPSKKFAVPESKYTFPDFWKVSMNSIFGLVIKTYGVV
jgi:hypothetical protein